LTAKAAPSAGAANGEGVETTEQLERLRALDCDEAQGDLISPPLAAEAFQILFGQPVLSNVGSS
jgi:EAL domain-containing protein (putative c-di-GMP-specific phosphodiesterase class I)